MSAATTGDTLDLDGYSVTLAGDASQELEVDGTVTFEDVDAGMHQVELDGVQVNCDPESGSTRTVSVTAGQTASATFDVSCAPALLDRIVFTSDRDDGDFDVYVMATDGSGVVKLTDGLSGDSGPAHVSPDGTQLVFQHEGSDDASSELYVMDVDGTNVTKVTENPVFDGLPTWSPNGGQVAFISDRDEEPATGGNLFVMNVQQLGLLKITDVGDFEDVGAPTWRPDGSRITYGQGSNGAGEVWAVNPDGTGLTNLTNDIATDGDPAWNPDGSRIAFVTDRSGDPEIYVMEADGSSPTRVTEMGGLDRYPTWTPDGSRIVYTTSRSGNFDIHAINLDGTGDEPLAASEADDLLPRRTPARD